MRVFVTGASGFIGSAVVPELIQAGHRVLGLARSEASARSLESAGAGVLRGDLEDLDSLKRGAAESDGVIHLGFIHDFSRFEACCATDRRAIEAMGEALAGSDRPFVVTSGLGLLKAGRLGTEDDAADPNSAASPRVPSEGAALDLAARGVRVSLLRLPPSVHGDGDHGVIPMFLDLAREKGVSAYLGDGLNRWPAVHRLDAARLFRLALETAPAGTRLHAVADEGVTTREVAEIIGRHLALPVVSQSAGEAAGHFGFLTLFASMDCPASSALTRERTGWSPTQPGLIADLEHGRYFEP